MLWTKTFIPTLRETPEGAEIPSHVLMLRSGLISQVMAGAYAYLPLGLRSLKKATEIVREEMNAAGDRDGFEAIFPKEPPTQLGRDYSAFRCFCTMRHTILRVRSSGATARIREVPRISPRSRI